MPTVATSHHRVSTVSLSENGRLLLGVTGVVAHTPNAHIWLWICMGRVCCRLGSMLISAPQVLGSHRLATLRDAAHLEGEWRPNAGEAGSKSSTQLLMQPWQGSA